MVDYFVAVYGIKVGVSNGSVGRTLVGIAGGETGMTGMGQ